MTLQKHKTKRLTGKPLAALNAKIHLRDNGCVLCGTWVDPGEKFHHIIFRSQRGGDEETNGAILCNKCHGYAHGPKAREIRSTLLEYISRRYKDDNHPERSGT